MHVTLRQPGTGKPVQIKIGFSWFFLLLTPLYGLSLFIRGMIAQGFGMAALAVLSLAINAAGGAPFGGLLLIGIGVFYGFRGNGIYARRLLIKGWKMEGDEQAIALARSQWGLSQ
jgi:hypothetical protein